MISQLRTGLLLGALLLLFSSCGGGGGGSGGGAGSPPAGDDTGGEATGPPKFSGFNFSLKEGDFWEFLWDYELKSTTSGGTTTTTDRGRFFVTLGAPKVINNITAYEVKITGRGQSSESLEFSAPRWKYIAVANNQILGSEDGMSLSVIFDGRTGRWPGSGYFTTFDAAVLFEAGVGSISNAYINEAAVKVEASASKDQCEFFPGIGTICGSDDPFSVTKQEFYKEGIGPIGYLREISQSFGGSFPQAVTIKENIGMVAASLRGDALGLDLEEEPNDSSSQAKSLGLASTTLGDIERNDPGEVHAAVAANLDNPDQILADWYQFTLDSSQTVTIDLSFEDISADIQADLDLYFFNSNLDKIGESLGDNSSTDNPTERIQALLAVGTYYIGVQAFITPNGRIVYTLEVN